MHRAAFSDDVTIEFLCDKALEDFDSRIIEDLEGIFHSVSKIASSMIEDSRPMDRSIIVLPWL